MIENQMYDVVRYLQSKHIKVTERNEWLQGCCEWYNSNNPPDNNEELRKFVHDQWLLADLREIGEGSLPANIINIPKTCVNHRIVLQVDSVVDVAESCYSQILKIRNVSTANIEATEIKPQDWEPKKKRMLKLTCTDGKQTVYGMEYKTIPALKDTFLPGFKILIIGPVECRKGVLLLESRNVQVLGGETDSLVVKNALENILARKLNLPENANPSYPEQIRNDTSNRNLGNDDDANNTAQTMDNRSENIENFSDDNDDIFLSEHLTQVENLFRSGTLQNPPNENFPTNSNVSTISNSNHESSSSHRSDQFSTNTTFISSYASRPSTSSNSCIDSSSRKVGVACPIVSSNNFSSKRPAPSPTQSELKIARPNPDSTICQNRIREFQTFNQNIGPSSSTPNFKVNELTKFLNSKRTVKCDASFVRITSKPKIRDEIWNFSGEIGDGTGTVNVAFSDPFLEKMFEFSAIEIVSQKERMKSNPDIKERIDAILRRGVQRITSLKGIFQIEFSDGTNLPKVINVIE